MLIIYFANKTFTGIYVENDTPRFSHPDLEEVCIPDVKPEPLVYCPEDMGTRNLFPDNW